MAAQLPVVFRSGGGDNTFSFDWFDAVAGAGYKSFYAAGAKNSAGNIYFLTTNSTFKSDEGNFTVDGDSRDLDFDITFNQPITIAAADVFIQYGLIMNGIDANNMTPTFKIYHVTSGGTETELLSVVGPTTSDADPVRRETRLVKAAITSKVIKIGEKIRFNLTTSSTNMGANCVFYYDPSGHLTFTDGTGGTGNSSLKIDIPFKIAL